MKVFVDTSAFYALVCRSDQSHREVTEIFRDLGGRGGILFTTSYVLSETMGLLQIRHGFEAVRGFVGEVLPVVRVLWVGSEDHEAGWRLMQREPKRHTTIVDATGMTMMIKEGIHVCLGFDMEFRRQGFRLLPEA